MLLHVTEFTAYWPAAFAITALGASALALRIRASALGPAIAAHFAYNLVMVAAIRSLS